MKINRKGTISFLEHDKLFIKVYAYDNHKFQYDDLDYF